MSDYAVKANSASISGLSISDISDIQVGFVNSYINSLLNVNFGVENSRTQYFDITGDERELLLDRWPVTSITSLIDNQRDTPVTLIQDTDYFLEEREGIIKLIEDEFNILKGSAYLTVGMRTVKCIYKWGYLAVPNAVSSFADWMVAWIAEAKNALGASKTTDGQVLRKVRAGNYEEAYDIGNVAINDKYKAILSEMTAFLVRSYMRYGDPI
jgi:hypothetical protein